MSGEAGPSPRSGYLRDSEKNARRFFSIVSERLASDVEFDASVFCVAHVLPGTHEFIEGLSGIARVALVLAKPNSINADELRLLQSAHPVQTLERDAFMEASYVTELIQRAVPAGNFVLLDIGGYFAPTLVDLVDRFADRLLGVIEDTENGLRRYLQVRSLGIPIVSVADSDIKETEDYLVGQWIVFSTEALMREFGSILSGRLATVIGFGRIGRSVAEHLALRGVSVAVVETNPIRAIAAKARGFRVLSMEDALARGNIVISATGNMALTLRALQSVRSGSYIATVTSADDEIDVAGLRKKYQSERVAEHVERVSVSGQWFYLLNEGNAVNFVHRGGLGPFIRPVQGEILIAMIRLLQHQYSAGVTSVDRRDRRAVARAWLEAFASVSAEG